MVGKDFHRTKNGIATGGTGDKLKKHTNVIDAKDDYFFIGLFPLDLKMCPRYYTGFMDSGVTCN